MFLCWRVLTSHESKKDQATPIFDFTSCILTWGSLDRNQKLNTNTGNETIVSITVPPLGQLIVVRQLPDSWAKRRWLHPQR